MKNISRRVFIKGLAVAGVAAAASTVLAGCNTNMIPGVDDDQDNEVTEPAASNKYTFTNVDGKTLVISAPSAVTTAVGAGNDQVKLFVPVTIENNLGVSVTFADSTAASAATELYRVVLSASGYDDEGNSLSSTALAFETASDDYSKPNLLVAAYSTIGTKDNSVSRILMLDAMDENWAKVTITAKVYKPNKDNQSSGNKYYYNSVETDKYEFTYTR